MALIEGTVAPGWEPVRVAFENNFVEHGDLGAGVAVFHRGRPVVDLVGGYRDRERTVPYGHDALQLVFSTTKGVASACVALCVERGWLDPLAPAQSLWPELPAAITVEQVMSHQAGLVTIEPPLTLDECLDWSTAVHGLEHRPGVGARHPARVPRHHLRLAGRRARAPCRSGAPVARLMGAPPPTDPAVIAEMLARSGPGTLGARALTVSGAFPMAGKDLPWNKPEVHAAQLGGANAVTNARSLATLYGAMVAEVDGLRLLSPDTVELVRRPRTNGPDACMGVEMRFGLGFMLDSSFNPLLDAGSFGHPGAGGSLAFADPESGVGFGYVMNQMYAGLAADPRPAALIAAIRQCL